MKKSWSMSKGHTWQLIGLYIILALPYQKWFFLEILNKGGELSPPLYMIIAGIPLHMIFSAIFASYYHALDARQNGVLLKA